MKKNIGAQLGLYPTPVVVVGTYDEQGKPNLITLAWVGICCSEPPCVQAAVRKNRYSHAALAARKAFTVNVPSARYVAETDYVGLVSGRDADKFGAANLTPVRGGAVDAPMVKEFPVSMECRLVDKLELGSHDMFVGEIAACWVDEAVFADSGKPDIKKIDPLVFSIGAGYFGLGDFITGSYGAGKKFIK